MVDILGGDYYYRVMESEEENMGLMWLLTEAMTHAFVNAKEKQKGEKERQSNLSMSTIDDKSSSTCDILRRKHLGTVTRSLTTGEDKEELSHTTLVSHT